MCLVAVTRESQGPRLRRERCGQLRELRLAAALLEQPVVPAGCAAGTVLREL